MNRPFQCTMTALALLMLGSPAGRAATTLVEDTWQDGDRSYPAAPVYSEAGVHSDGDGELESAWFNGGEGSVMTATPGNLRMDPADAPAAWTTYFTSEAGSFTLLTDDWVQVTWQFRTGDVNASDTGQNFRIAMVDSFPSARLTADGLPPGGGYLGLAMFGNMAETTGNANAFQLRERNNLPTGPLLEDGDAWIPVSDSIGNGLGSGTVGYADDTDYTFTMKIKRVAPVGLDITMTMAGGNIGSTGSVSLNVVDTTPISATYDTFSVYVANEGSTASFLDTKLFKVELGHGDVDVPEPAAAALAAFSLVALARRRRPHLTRII